MSRLKSVRVFTAALGFAAMALATTASAARVDYQEITVSLSRKDGRPEPPVISVSNATEDGQWRATDAPVTLKLRVYARVNTTADVRRIRIGVPALPNPKGNWIIYSVHPPYSGRDATVHTVQTIPSNALAIPSLMAGKDCAARFGQANPPQGAITIPTKLDVEVEVDASKKDTHVRRSFWRSVEAEIRCTPLSRTVAEPQRTPGAPQRTPGEPKRTLSPYRPLTAELGFARAGNSAGCPVDIRQSIRIVSPGPGTAKVYIVRQDSPGVLGAPLYVNVATRLPDAKYAGVLQTTVRITNTLKRAYRVLAVNPFGEPVASPWAVLDVKC